jgi:hypothetical protein
MKVEIQNHATFHSNTIMHYMIVVLIWIKKITGAQQHPIMIEISNVLNAVQGSQILSNLTFVVPNLENSHAQKTT